MVEHHDAATREVRFNERLHAFARYWGFRPRACAPYRARTKGKDERGVGYVKHNAIAGHRFVSWAALEAHLAWWMREIADVRVHGTTGEAPMARFARDEAAALRPLAGRAPFVQMRELVRRVQADCASRSTPTAIACLGGSLARACAVVGDGRSGFFMPGARWRRMSRPPGGASGSSIRRIPGVAGFARPAVAAAPSAAEPAGCCGRCAEYERFLGGAWEQRFMTAMTVDHETLDRAC